jgi:hypothetical protein
MSAEDAAQSIFAQLLAGEFWVSTHPQLTELMASQRADSLSKLATPYIDTDSAFNLE